MITSLPAYRPPTAEDVHCYCRRVYCVNLGVEDYQARFAEKVAQEIGAIFIDSRVTPFVTCAFGQSLDFAPECSLLVQ
jgi:hypothetical protein